MSVFVVYRYNIVGDLDMLASFASMENAEARRDELRSAIEVAYDDGGWEFGICEVPFNA